MGAIPIGNIYYLLCYAWDEFAPRQLAGKAAEEFPDTLHLFAHLLVVGLKALHRRGLETGYIPIQESTSTLRGRILIAQSISLMSKQPKRICCVFDEMTADILSNQILKATLKRLLGESTLEPQLRGELRHSLAFLSRVGDVDLNARVFHEVRLHQNNHLYSFLVTICRFFFECMEAQDRGGHYRFRAVDQDEKRMRRVFEKFVRHFFARRQRTFQVKKERLDWFATAAEGSSLKFLPIMETDVTLRSVDRTIVIECKYTESLYKNRFFADKLRSPHLYQLCAYLRNLENHADPDRQAEGILLYPTSGINFDQSFRLQGHQVRIRTINLNQPWTEIEGEMLSLIRPQ